MWGVPLPDPLRVQRALMACLEMRGELALLNQLRVGRGLSPLQVGMGVNDGEVIAGNIGSSQRMEFTIIGNTVNIASRIEALTKKYETDLLVAETVMNQTRDRFLFTHREVTPIRGLSQEMAIYRVAGVVNSGGRQILVPEFKGASRVVPPPFKKRA